MKDSRQSVVGLLLTGWGGDEVGQGDVDESIDQLDEQMDRPGEDGSSDVRQDLEAAWAEVEGDVDSAVESSRPLS